MNQYIEVKGARVNNLKNIEVKIPRNQFIVITGLSGSGKSSLAFDTLYAEGQRRYVESLSAYARQFLGRMNKPEVDYIKGLPPAIAIEQKVTSRNPRSTVGTSTEIYEYLRLLFARIGRTYSPVSGKEVRRCSADDVVAAALPQPWHPIHRARSPQGERRPHLPATNGSDDATRSFAPRLRWRDGAHGRSHRERSRDVALRNSPP